MYATHNTLGATIRMQSIALLNLHLAATLDLHAQIKMAHWNVRGATFISVHALFDQLAGEVLEMSDTLAERVGALGGTAHGTLQIAMERSFLIPYPHLVAPAAEHLFAVSGALAAFGQSARDAIAQTATFGDVETSDLFTGLSRQIDKSLWLVEAHQEPREA